MLYREQIIKERLGEPAEGEAIAVDLILKWARGLCLLVSSRARLAGMS
jgi:hypothetical protein